MDHWLEAHPWRGIAGFFGIAFAIGGLILLLAGSGTIGETAAGACGIAPDFVEEVLVAPQDADFGDCTARRTTDGTWEVSGRVDAPNAFGARLRHTYRVSLRYAGDDRWSQRGPVDLIQQ